EAAPLSRRALAARHRVSRSHVSDLIAAAAAAGHVRVEAPDRLAFSPQMSEEAERHFALTFFVIAACAEAAIAAAGLTQSTIGASPG
ncbi:MAG: hypothetical protein ACRED8_09570, partial [Caulobacteraceae bacterium]